MDSKAKYWTELSDYDLETARAMLESKRYLYVGFMCHQAIEKIFKALVSVTGDEAVPHTHNLTFLARRGNFSDLLSEDQKDFVDTLEPLNIEARYPSHKERVLQGLSEQRCRDLIAHTEELQAWIKQKLSVK